MNLQERIKEIEEEKRNLKKLAKLQKKVEGKTLLQKLSSKLDNLILLVCKPFASRVQEIQYKREDLQGYQADKLISDALNVAEHLLKRARKGKELKERHKDLIEGMKAALSIIEIQQLGKTHTRASELSQALQSIEKHYQQEIKC